LLVDLVQTTTRDGVRLDGALQMPSHTSYRATSVDAFCFFHGTGGNFYGSTLFDSLAERLVEMGSAVLRVNTRGHDGLSTAATTQGGRLLGAAYEIVDDCRHDVAAWVDYLRERVGLRVGLVGHSLGAVKAIYALAHQQHLATACLIALSPPRLAYSVFCSQPEFLETYNRAAELMAEGQASALLEVKLPLPYVITAAGYVEKYGPDERYDFTRFLTGVNCPALITYGGQEVEKNPAFRGLPELLAGQAGKLKRVRVATIPRADHFYTGLRHELVDCVENWVREKLPCENGSER
jgi:pimeloyl-ACP methyl ester carboxylesterase